MTRKPTLAIRFSCTPGSGILTQKPSSKINALMIGILSGFSTNTSTMPFTRLWLSGSSPGITDPDIGYGMCNGAHSYELWDMQLGDDRSGNYVPQGARLMCELPGEYSACGDFLCPFWVGSYQQHASRLRQSAGDHRASGSRHRPLHHHNDQ